jgi:mannose-1-phosphate guanylyltransferase
MEGQVGATAMPPTTPQEKLDTHRRWGVVLAGGDGLRLRPLTRLICGDDRPKQFCPLFDEQTLLAQTLRRAERAIPREQLRVSLSGQHSKWYLEESDLRPDQRIVKLFNGGTATAVAHSILTVAKMDRDAIAAVFPSDHHYLDEPLFAAALESAFVIAAAHPSAVVLMGAHPDYPETDYGWIEPGTSVPQTTELFHVDRFREKPSVDVARNLLKQGSLWNTLVMVGHVKAFLEMLRSALPELVGLLWTLQFREGRQTQIDHSLYQRIPSLDLSRRVLAMETPRLFVLRLGQVGWSDLGSPERALLIADTIASEPKWVSQWRRAKGRNASGLRSAKAVVAS